MMAVLRKKAVSLAIKAVAEKEGTFSGLGSVFGNEDSYGDIVMPGAFEKSLARHKKAGTLPALLWQHQMDNPIGIYHRMEETDEGLDMDGEFALAIEKGRDAHALTRMKALRGLSIGFTIPKGGAEYKEEIGVWHLKEIDLWEVSVVTFPANDLAQITDVRSAIRAGEMPTERDFEGILRDAGYPATLAKACVAKGYRDVLREADRTGNNDADSIVNYINEVNQRMRSQ